MVKHSGKKTPSNCQEEFKDSELQAFAVLYSHIAESLTDLLKQNFSLCENKVKVKELYKEAATYYSKQDPQVGYMTSHGMLVSPDTNIRNIICLQRFAMSVPAAQNNALNLTDQMVRNTIPEGAFTGTDIEHCLSASKFIGKGNKAGKTLELAIWKHGYRMPNEFINSENPFGGKTVRGLKNALMSARRETYGERCSKRAGTLPGVAMCLVSVYLAIVTAIRKLGDGLVDDPKNKPAGQRIYRKCQVLLFIVMSLTSPARGRELLLSSMDDFTESVKGNEDFMLICRVLMQDPSALPRAKFYKMRRLHAKHLMKLMVYMQQMLPQYASALSLPDIMSFCLSIMVRIQPEKLLSPLNNPFMHLFLGTGNGLSPDEIREKAAAIRERDDYVSDDDEDPVETIVDRVGNLDFERPEIADIDPDIIKARALAKECGVPVPASRRCFGEGNLEMGTMDSQLKQDLPPGFVRKMSITGYSSRTGISHLLDKLCFMATTECKVIQEFLRIWYGHSAISIQIHKYAQGCGRFKICTNCADEKTDSKVCWCNVLRTRPATGKIKKK